MAKKKAEPNKEKVVALDPRVNMTEEEIQAFMQREQNELEAHLNKYAVTPIESDKIENDDEEDEEETFTLDLQNKVVIQKVAEGIIDSNGNMTITGDVTLKDGTVTKPELSGETLIAMTGDHTSANNMYGNYGIYPYPYGNPFSDPLQPKSSPFTDVEWQTGDPVASPLPHVVKPNTTDGKPLNEAIQELVRNPFTDQITTLFVRSALKKLFRELKDAEDKILDAMESVSRGAFGSYYFETRPEETTRIRKKKDELRVAMNSVESRNPDFSKIPDWAMDYVHDHVNKIVGSLVGLAE